MQIPLIPDTYDFNRKKDPYATLVTTPQQFSQMINALTASKIIAYDTETTGLDWARKSVMCGMSFGVEYDGNIHSWYVPIRHIDGSKQLDIKRIQPFIKQILEDNNKLIVAFNIKFDDHISRKENIFISKNRCDVQIDAHFYNENIPRALKYRVQSDLGDSEAHLLENLVDEKIRWLAQSIGLGKEEYTSIYGYSQLPIGLAGIYACLDAKYTFQLFKLYREKLRIPDKYPRVYQTETRLTKIICDMEEYGIKIDVDRLSDFDKKMSIKLKDIDMNIRRILGSSYFNVASDKDLVKFLLNTMKLPLTKKTKKGNNLSVDGEVLKSFLGRDSNGLLENILKFRTFDKLHSSFVLPILNFVDSNNVLHGSFKQLGTVNGRLSSEEPNLQNIAKGKFELEGETSSLRRVFIPKGKNRVISLYDYSQIELRVMAFYSKDKIMTDVYINNGDIHESVSKEVGITRDGAKAINFGLNYGMAAKGLSRKIKKSEEEAEAYLNLYFKRFCGVASFKKQFTEYMKRNSGYFQNIFGRPRRIQNILSHNNYDRGKAERKGMSSLIAGTAAELTKESIVKVSDFIEENKLNACLNNTIHDEIWIESDINEISSVMSNTKRIMESYPEFNPVPIQVSCSYTTTNWGDKKEVKF